MFQVTERDRTRGAGFLRDARIHTQHSCRMKPVAETLEALWWRPEAETVRTPTAPRPLSGRTPQRQSGNLVARTAGWFLRSPTSFPCDPSHPA